MSLNLTFPTSHSKTKEILFALELAPPAIRDKSISRSLPTANRIGFVKRVSVGQGQ
jgi:hypothetical protein